MAVTAKAAATTRPASGYTGAAPVRGSIGLLVTNRPSSPDSLVVALNTGGCAAEALAVLDGGVWRVYVPQAPAAIKARLGFPAEIGPTVPFFVRCAV